MIGQVKRNGKLAIIVKLNEFKGKQYVDVRNYYTDGKSEPIPTKKGISIPVDNLSDVITLLEKAEAKLQGGKDVKR